MEFFVSNENILQKHSLNIKLNLTDAKSFEFVAKGFDVQVGLGCFNTQFDWMFFSVLVGSSMFLLRSFLITLMVLLL